jgi:KDO2-lipid IV(A) lauroyltransferase
MRSEGRPMKSRHPSERKDLSRFFQAKPNTFLARLLPFSIYRHYLSFLGFYYFSIRRQERKRLSRSLRFVLGRRLSRIKFRYILFKTYFGIFEHYSEKMINAYRSLPTIIEYFNESISLTNKDWLDELKLTKRGGILVTAHFGAVEYLPIFLSSMGYRVAIIVRFKTDRLRKVLTHKADLLGLEAIDADNQNVIYRALEAIKKGRILITLCDEVKNWRPCKTKTMFIFGQSVPCDRTLDILFRRSKAPCCLGLMQRVKNGFNLSIDPLDGKDDNTSLTEAAWSILEQYIYRYPDQWYQWPNFETEYTKYATLSESYAN